MRMTISPRSAIPRILATISTWKYVIRNMSARKQKEYMRQSRSKPPDRSRMLVCAKYDVTPLTPAVKSMYAAAIPTAAPRPMIRPNPYDMYE